jgi:hypothetical protein
LCDLGDRLALGKQLSDGTSRHHAQGKDLGLMCLLGTFAKHTRYPTREGMPSWLRCCHRLGFFRIRSSSCSRRHSCCSRSWRNWCKCNSRCSFGWCKAHHRY